MVFEVNNINLKKIEGSSTGTTDSLSSSARIKIDYGHSAQVDNATENQVRNLVKLVYPKVNWDELGPNQKSSYYKQFADGTLTEKADAVKTKIEETRNNVKNMKPSDAVKLLVTETISYNNPDYKNLNDAQKKEVVSDAIFKHIQKFVPELKEPETQKGKERFMKQYGFKAEALVYAFQQGEIDNIEEIKGLSPTDIAKMEFRYAEEMKKSSPEEFEKNELIKRTYAQGMLIKGVAETNNMTLEELRESKDRYNLTLEYLRGKDSLNKYEKSTKEILENLSTLYNGDLSNARFENDGSVTDSYLLKISDGKDVDWSDPAQQKVLQQHILADLEGCANEEERNAKLIEIIKNSNSPDEAFIKMQALMRLNKADKISIDAIKNATKSANMTSHMMVATSMDASIEGQMAIADIVKAESTSEASTFTESQVVGFTQNIATKYDTEAQTYAIKAMIDTGYESVRNALPDIYKNLDAKTVAELKQYENSVPITRPVSSSTNSNSKGNQAVTAGSNYTVNQFNNIVANAIQPPSVIEQIRNGVVETFDIIMGKTPDVKNIGVSGSIASFDSALEELKQGTSLAKVFTKCSGPLQKEFIKKIMESPFKDQALEYLSKNVDINILMSSCPSSSQKNYIAKIIERSGSSTEKAGLNEYRATHKAFSEAKA